MLEKKSWILSLKKDGIYGFGEFSIIESLSPDWNQNYESTLQNIVDQINNGQDLNSLIKAYREKPSIVFGLETANLDLINDGKQRPFDTPFADGKEQIPINGLIWMNDKETMFKSIQQKLDEGFKCIKLKIGAIDYESEIELLKHIRNSFSKETIEIRVDANGAFDPKNAAKVLDDLNSLDIHSIEQPIKQGQFNAMAELCRTTPTPIALDEELIGIHNRKEKIELLETIRPQYIILKPSLHGGISGSKEWIDLAEKRGIGWWMTSALESNIGLNAIAQFASSLKTKMYQGLGTGSLYYNNIESPLTVKQGHIYSDQNKKWVIPSAFFF